jgi:hypothetical protein
MGEVVGGELLVQRPWQPHKHFIFHDHNHQQTYLPCQQQSGGMEQWARHKGLANNIGQTWLPLAFGLSNVMVPKKQLA